MPGPFWALNAPPAQVERTSPIQVRSFFPRIYNGLTFGTAKTLRCVPNDAVGVRAKTHGRHVGWDARVNGRMGEDSFHGVSADAADDKRFSRG